MVGFGAFVAACLAHVQSLTVGVLADDHAILRAIARPGAGVLAAFPAGIGGYFRPVTMASLALVDTLAPGSAFAQHAFGLAVHAVTAGIVASIARRLAGDGLLATALGVLYAVHPAHAATVSWIAARGDLLATFGNVAAIALALRGTGAASVGAAIAATLAIGSKESAYALVGLLPIAGELAARATLRPIDSAEGQASEPRAVRRSTRGVAVVAAVVALAHALVARLAFGGPQRALAGLRSPIEAVSALASAVVRAVAPGPLARALAAAVFERGEPTAAFAAVALAAVLVGLALVVVAWRSVRRAGRDGASMALGIGGVLVALAPLAVLGGADERLLGTPLAMMSIALVTITPGPSASEGTALLQRIALGTIAVIFGGLTLREGAEWRAASHLADVHAQSLTTLKSLDPRRPIVLLTYPSRLGGALVFSDDANSALGDDVVALGPVAIEHEVALDGSGAIAFADPRTVDVRAGGAGDCFDFRGVSREESVRMGSLAVSALDVSSRGELRRYAVAWSAPSEPLLLRATRAGFVRVDASR